MNPGAEWPDAALHAFGLPPSAIVRVDARSALLRLGGFPAGLWVLPFPARETVHGWEAACEDGLAAPLLRAGSGRPCALLDGHSAAVLTVWDGTDLPRAAPADELTALAGFLGRLRRSLARSGRIFLPGPEDPWVESWRKRLRRLDAFAVAAARRLHPTEFDRIFLDRWGFLRAEAERSLRELEAAAPHLPFGAELRRIERRMFYRGKDGAIGLKNPAGLAAGVPLRDLYRLLARYLPRIGFDVGAAAAALAAYAGGRPPARGELAALAAALRFPEEYYGLACRYFLNERGWPLRTFLRLERRVWAAGEARRALVEEIPSLLS